MKKQQIMCGICLTFVVISYCTVKLLKFHTFYGRISVIFLAEIQSFIVEFKSFLSAYSVIFNYWNSHTIDFPMRILAYLRDYVYDLEL